MEVSLLLDFYGDMLTDRQRDFIGYYYNDDLSLAEIAENTGISRQGVRDTVKRAECQLIEFEDRLGLAGRFTQMTKGLAEIKLCAEKIRGINMSGSLSREINDLCVRIGSLADGLSE